jgi:hypothetical protein
MEKRLRPGLQSHRDHSLRDSVRDSGNPQDPCPTTMRLGISTAFTAGGKYVPEDIRFQEGYSKPFWSEG